MPRRVSASALAGIFLGLAAVAAAKAPPVVSRLILGSYRLEVADVRNWERVVNPERGYVLFLYTDKPALRTHATIGLFRIVVPADARGGDRAKLAGDYATRDASGMQQMFFKTNAGLKSFTRKPKSFQGGELFSYAEPNDANGLRQSSTTFIRGWVFFPRDFAETGALFLVLGRQDTPDLQTRPDELARVEEIIAGIRERRPGKDSGGL